MISLTAILATGGLAESLPMIIMIAVGVLLGLAFLRGFLKGFRTVSWDGLCWLVAGLMFVFIGYLAPMKGDNAMVDFWFALLLAMFCAAASFALFKVLGYFLRPKMRWINDDINADTSLAEYGLEFEPEYVDYDGEHDYQPYGKRIYKTGYGAPSLFFRILGGAASAANVGVVLWALLSIFLLVVDVSPLKDSLGGILADPTLALVFANGKNYVLDYVFIGVMLLMAKEGYGKGLISSLRGIIITVGGIGSIVLSFFLPFSAFAAEGFFAEVVAKFAAAFVDFGIFGDILGKLLVGVLLLALSIIILVILNVLLKSLCKAIETTGITRELDALLGAVVYLVLGALVCLAIWAVLAGFDVIGLFSMSQMLGERAFLSGAIFEFLKELIAPLLQITA